MNDARPDLIAKMTPDDLARAARLAALNDEMRANLLRVDPHRSAVLMGALARELSNLDEGMTQQEVAAIFSGIIMAIKDFGPFIAENDPYGEHDFGAFEFTAPGFNDANDKIMWKISHYDLEKEIHSPDPTDAAVTHRVMTIFFARDY